MDAHPVANWIDCRYILRINYTLPKVNFSQDRTPKNGYLIQSYGHYRKYLTLSYYRFIVLRMGFPGFDHFEPNE